MEPEVHIIEKYYQELHNCFTMTNIQVDREGQKEKYEIDLLAFDPENNEYYHIESSIRTTSKLRLKSKVYSKKNYTVEKFYREKFANYLVEKHINGIIKNKPYNKILVVWDTQDDLKELNQKAKNLGIKVISLMGIIQSLSNHKKTSGSRDIVLRIMELVYLEKKWEKEVLKKI